MPLDPQAEALRRRREQQGTPPLYQLSVAEARKADLAAIQADAGVPEPVGEVIDRYIPGPAGALPIRIYRPAGRTRSPVLLYFFGGGGVLGCIDTSDGICRTLTNSVPCVTVSVGYRLAPEHRFPAAVQDCYAAARWVGRHAEEIGGDDGKIAVGGDSAGGNLAAVVALMARDNGGPALAYQLLVYPNTDFLSDTPSLAENVDPYLFNKASVEWYRGHYLAVPDDGASPLASPLRADDVSGVPPATIITAEYDPLRDQGEQYAERLAAGGVAVTLTRYAGMPHGFFAMPGVLEAGRRAQAQAAGDLSAALHGPPPPAP
jgi:acetyl esterase